MKQPYKKLSPTDRRDLITAIRKYRRLAEVDTTRKLRSLPVSSHDCALCRRYSNNTGSCSSACPVKAFTRQDGCRGTPYYGARCAGHTNLRGWRKVILCDAAAGGFFPWRSVKAAWKRLNTHGAKMADFLQKLLDNG